MKFIKIFLVLIAISTFLIACTDSSNNSAENTNESATNEVNAAPSETPDELAQGRKLYKEHCAKCHKDDGTGGEADFMGNKVKSENLATQKMFEESDEEYIEYMVEGIPEEMPSFKDVLTKEEMNEIVKYIRTEFQSEFKTSAKETE